MVNFISKVFFEALPVKYKGLLDICDLAVTAETLAIELERVFIYALTWSVGGLLEIEDRMKFTEYIITTAGNNKTALPTMQVNIFLLYFQLDVSTLSLVIYLNLESSIHF